MVIVALKSSSLLIRFLLELNDFFLSFPGRVLRQGMLILNVLGKFGKGWTLVGKTTFLGPDQNNTCPY